MYYSTKITCIKAVNLRDSVKNYADFNLYNLTQIFANQTRIYADICDDLR